MLPALVSASCHRTAITVCGGHPPRQPGGHQPIDQPHHAGLRQRERCAQVVDAAYVTVMHEQQRGRRCATEAALAIDRVRHSIRQRQRERTDQVEVSIRR